MAKQAMKARSSQRTKDSANTKKRILEAAQEVFAEKGLAGPRMREIARIAEMNLALSNRYFANKETLYLRVIEDALEKIRLLLEAP